MGKFKRPGVDDERNFLFALLQKLDNSTTSKIQHVVQ